MAGFKDIIGQERLIESLSNSIKKDKVSHAYIFNGEEGIGKMMLAEAFALNLECENNDGEACLNCRTCKQVLSHNEPDVIYVTPEKEGYISVADIREKVNGDILIKPYSSRYKIYIIDNADTMNEAAQNALLKTIEEPPRYAILILLSSNPERFLPTIRSRCIEMTLRPVDNCSMEDYLKKSYDGNKELIPIVSAFAKGNIGRAKRLMESDAFIKAKETALNVLKHTDDMSVVEIKSLVADKVMDSYPMDEFLDIFLYWYRDVLVYKTTHETKNLLFQDEIFDIKKQSKILSDVSITRIIDEIRIARSRIKGYVKPELAFELFIIRQKSEIEIGEKR